MASGPGVFFDGITATRRDVTVELTAASLVIRGADDHLYADWPYERLERLSSPDTILRLGLVHSPILARLEVYDDALESAIDDASATIDRSGAIDHRARIKIIGWSIAATISLVLVAIYGIPALAARLTPFVPYGLERRLGDGVEMQMRSMLGNNLDGKPFECGSAPGEKSGRAAVDKLVNQLEAAAALPIPLQAFVVRRAEANAIALPGGHVYIYEGLLPKAQRPDELAGVIAHEIGHVAHRDGTRSMLEAGGISFLFGTLLGDFVGGGAVVIAARTLIRSAYSRDVEGAADAYGVDLMNKIGGDGRALGTILNSISGGIEPGNLLTSDHPQTKNRIEAIDRLARPGIKQLLTPAEWSALQTICSG